MPTETVPLTRQQIFDRAYLGLASQGFAESNRKDAAGVVVCAYRGCYSRKCAIGWCIPDEVYTPEMEDWIPDVISSHPTLQAMFSADDGLFLLGLQTMHDSASDPDDMQARLHTFAAVHGLTLPTLPN